MTTEHNTQASPPAERALLLERITRLEVENAALRADPERALVEAALAWVEAEEQATVMHVMCPNSDAEDTAGRAAYAALRTLAAAARSYRAALVDGGDKGA
jgi:hypothetical protein